MGLLENLLLSLKMNTEASLGGPDSVEPIGGAEPISSAEVEDVDEEEYADMLKDIPTSSQAQAQPATPRTSEEEGEEKDDAELLRAAAAVEEAPRTIDANYESMSVKELTSLARQRGLSGIPQRKKEIIDLLKKSGVSAPVAPTPLASSPGELDGASFEVNLEEN